MEKPSGARPATTSGIWPRIGRLTRHTWVGYVAAFLAVALISWLIGFILSHLRISNISMLYLVAVVAVAIAFGSGPAVLCAALAFVAFDWFFLEPVHTFTVSDPAEWVALLLLLLTGVATGQLSAAQRRRAEEARRREREAVALFDLSQLLTAPALDRPTLQAAAGRLRDELDLAGVAILLPDENGQLRVRASVGQAEDVAAVEQVAANWRYYPGHVAHPDGQKLGRWVRVVPPALPGKRPARPATEGMFIPLKAGERPVGALRLVRAPGWAPFSREAERLLAAAAAQIGQAIERDRLRAEATQAEVLRQTDELRAALLSSVSHDLRTPLASIKTAAGSLLQSDVEWDAATQREFIQAIDREADRLNRLVSNLLDMSRIEAGALKPDKEWYPLADLVEDISQRLASRLAEHPLRVDVPEDLPPVPLDYVLIDEALTNLIENAVKYTPPGTPLTISARARDDAVELAVTDSGPGIPARDLPYVFDKFYRVQRPNRSGTHGTGLGLAIVKGIVEAHGGRVTAESVPGQGTTIRFTLPLREGAAPAASASQPVEAQP